MREKYAGEPFFFVPDIGCANGALCKWHLPHLSAPLQLPLLLSSHHFPLQNHHVCMCCIPLFGCWFPPPIRRLHLSWVWFTCGVSICCCDAILLWWTWWIPLLSLHIWARGPLRFIFIREESMHQNRQVLTSAPWISFSWSCVCPHWPAFGFCFAFTPIGPAWLPSYSRLCDPKWCTWAVPQSAIQTFAPPPRKGSTLCPTLPWWYYPLTDVMNISIVVAHLSTCMGPSLPSFQSSNAIFATSLSLRQ